MRLAVLIDGENVSHSLADQLFERVRELGHAAERIVYGNFDGPAKSWQAAAARHSLQMHHVSPVSKGKNTADIALTIGAMDLLRDEDVYGFCIVSSDGDFAALAGRIVRGGCEAYGFGDSRTTRGCRDAYSRFFLLELAPGKATPPAAGRPHPALRPIRSVLEQMEAADGWYDLATFGSEARRLGVDLKAFETKKMAGLLRATGQFELEPAEKPRRFRRICLRAIGA